MRNGHQLNAIEEQRLFELVRDTQIVASVARAQPIAGLGIEIVSIDGRTPCLFFDVPATGGLGDDRTVLFYGHLDKQPEMVGWREDLGPWKPVIEDGKLYGRGSGDDGYAVYCALTTIAAIDAQGAPRPRCVGLIETCEESGSYDLPEYLNLLEKRIQTPDLVIGLDSGCGNYEQLWSTTSLRGLINGVLTVEVLTEGVHSGDAMMSIPPWRLDRKTIDTIVDHTARIGKALNVKGPFNIQYLVKNGEVSVIEANVRASRSMPFVSKFVGFNLITLAAKAMTGKKLPPAAKDLWLKTAGFGIKVPQFSFMQLEGSDIVLGVEMQSTGEVACFGNSFYDALSKAYMAAGYSLPLSGSALITVGGQKNKEKLLPIISLITSMNYRIMATEHTAEFIENNNFKDIKLVYKISEPDRKPNIADLLYERKINFIINIPATSTREKYVGMLYDEYQIRRKAVEMGIPVLTTFEAASSFIKTLQWLRDNTPTIMPLKSYIVRE